MKLSRSVDVYACCGLSMRGGHVPLLLQHIGLVDNLLAIGGEHPIAIELPCFLAQHPYRGGIIYHQNRVRRIDPVFPDLLGACEFHGGGRLIRYWEEDTNLGAQSWAAGGHETASMRLYDSADGRQAKPPAEKLSGKEQIEGPLEGGIIHAASVINHL